MATFVTGKGTGGNATGATSLAISPATDFGTPLRMAVLAVAYDNAGANGADPFVSISDNVGNVWTSRAAALYDPGAASAGITLRIFTAQISQLLATDVVTISFGSTSVVAKAWSLYAANITGVPGAMKFITGAVNAGAATATPTVTTSSIPINDSIICAYAGETNVAVTADADVSNGAWSATQTGLGNSGTDATSARCHTQIKTVTGTATQTFNPTTAAAKDCILAWIQIAETSVVTGVAGGAGTGNGTASGSPTHLGAAVGSGAGAGVALGLRKVLGIAAGSGTGAATATGTVTAGAVMGTGAGSGAGAGAAVGKSTHLGTAAGSGAGAGAAVGKSTHLGTAVGGGAGAGVAVGVKKVFGVGVGSGVGAGTAVVGAGFVVNGTAFGSGGGVGSASGVRVVLALASGSGVSTAAALAKVTIFGISVGSGVGSGVAFGTNDIPVLGVAQGAGVGAGVAAGSTFTPEFIISQDLPIVTILLDEDATLVETGGTVEVYEIEEMV